MNLKMSRQVRQRWIIEGKLELKTPTSLSNGDDDPLVDLPIVVDASEGRALLTGASLAGALRSYLAEFSPTDAVALFGGERKDAKGYQSALIVEDALGPRPNIELREGVSINPATRTAREGELYDRQLLAAGTRFDIGFELVITKRHEESEVNGKPLVETMKAALAQALYGLQEGDIRLGGRKRRGYGECRVVSWKAWAYDLTEKADLQAWLTHGRRGPWDTRAWGAPGANILDWSQLHGVTRPVDNRLRADLTLDLDVDGSVLIRSGFETENGPDTTHLQSRRDGRSVPVLSGTSLAGVLRGQALRIARTIAGEANQDKAEETIKEMFGYMPKPAELKEKQKKRASRLTVSESEISGHHSLVQSRVKIDRFTGGAFESALFAEQPVFGGEVTVRLSLVRPSDAELGLLLLLMKDLWTGFVPIGGEASVGRGRLRGRKATLSLARATYEFSEANKQLTVNPPGAESAQALQGYVDALHKRLGKVP